MAMTEMTPHNLACARVGLCGPCWSRYTIFAASAFSHACHPGHFFLHPSSAAPFVGLRLHAMRAWPIVSSVRRLLPECRSTGQRFSSTRAHSTSSPQSASPFYCTTPIFYVNANPHVGHLHSCVLADVLTRWNQTRFQGWSTAGDSPPTSRTRALLSTGTDEHGLKIQKVAETQGVEPRALCDRVSKRFRELADAAGVNYTTFIRTTEDRHKTAVHEVWRRLEAGGHIYKSVHEGWYAESDEAFYPEGQIREVVDSKTGVRHHESIETGQKVEWSSEENYKFRMSAFQDRLVDWYESNPESILPRSRHAEVVAELKSGIEDLSISRPSSRLAWGIPVPGDPSQSIYVWVDALVNYLTVTGFPEPSKGPSAWPADVHVIGKDIIRFHAIYWPSILMAASLPLPRQIVSHSHWTMNKAKMSKSRGNVIDPFAEMDFFGRDSVRYFLCQFGGGLATDSDYSHAMLRESYRRLQGQLGNLLSRVFNPKILGRLEDIARGPLPAVTVKDSPAPASGTRNGYDDDEEATGPQLLIHRSLLDSEMEPIDAAFASTASRFEADMARAELSQALDGVFKLLQEVNTRLHELEPWRPGTSDAAFVLAVYESQEVLRLVSTLLGPFMPTKMAELRDVLGLSVRQQGQQDQQQKDGEDENQSEMESLPWAQVSQMQPTIAVIRRYAKMRPLFPPLPEEDHAA
ncbi:unnamed protein product [Parajaminaea phylloscopi]